MRLLSRAVQVNVNSSQSTDRSIYNGKAQQNEVDHVNQAMFKFALPAHRTNPAARLLISFSILRFEKGSKEKWWR